MNLRKIGLLLSTIIILFSVQSCKNKQNSVNSVEPVFEKTQLELESNNGLAAMPQALVYKTAKDYIKNVPVIMNSEKTEIISYPAPSDIYFKGKFAYPTHLINGYLLDNRGIGSNVAFLVYTYEEYAALKEVPDKNFLLDKILDKKPLTELWNCGPRTYDSDEINKLNSLIKRNFPNCKQLVVTVKTTLQL
jgi:hypothetical protein